MSIEKQKAGSSGPTKRNYSKLNTHEHQVSLIKLKKIRKQGLRMIKTNLNSLKDK